MKRKSLLFLMCFLALVGVAKAQLTLTVNDGTTTNNYVPIYGLYVDEYLRCQYVQPAADLSQMTGGTINSLTFYLSTPASASWGSANFQVYLKEVESTTISAFIDPATATTVYNGSLDGTQSTMTVTFDTPYTYNGGNLLIGFDNTVKGSYKSASFSGVTANGASVQGNSSSSVGAVNPTQRNFLPKMDITYLPGGGDPVVVESIEADDVTVGTGHTAQINYTVLPTNAWYKQVSFASANTSIATVNQDGLVTAVAVGNTTVTITSTEYPAVSTTINVTVEQTYEITIGEGISTSADLPLNMYYNYSLTEQLYTAEEIGVGACYINSVAFKLVEGTANKTYALDVYMLNTDKTAITTQDYVNVTADNLVFSGNVNFTTGDWTTISFTTPFTYTGGNVLLVVDNNTGGYDGNSRKFAVFSATEQAIYQRSDQTNFDPTNISIISQASVKNQVIFEYSPIGDVTPVTGITVTPATMDLIVGETGEISYTIAPEDAFNQNVNFSIEQDDDFISVSNGTVTALAAGTATVTVTTVDGGFTGTCVVTVSNQNVTEITAQDVTVLQTKTAQIEYTVLPENATITDVTFTSADESIATVSETGVVTGVAVGETTITIASVSNPLVTATINVTVEYLPTLNEALNVNGGTLEFTNDATYPWIVEMDGDRIYAMSGNGGVGSSVSTLTLVVNAAEGDALSFDFKAWGEGTSTIYDHCIFSVDDELQFEYGAYQNDWETYNLVFTAGEHTLTWTFTKDSSVNGTGDYFAIDNVTYEPIIVIPVESITADDITMMTGETAQITPTVLPADANQAVTYASANTSIATVSEDGLVTAVAAGTTTITITSVSTPEVSTIINVTVTSNPNNVIFSIEAPANAQPGDQIEAAVVVTGEYAAASLGIRFTYDSTVFVYQGRTQSGVIAEAVENGTINTFTFHPNASGDLHTEPGEVMYSVISLGDPFYYDGTLVTIKLKVKADASLGTTSTLNVEEAGETFVDNGQVHITNEPGYADVFIGQGIPMAITGYGTGDGKYYLLSSPIGAVNPVNVENMLNENDDYDLYYFDQSGVDDGVALEWRNYKAKHFDLEVGKGYLYASKEDVTLMFYGAAYTGDGEVSLDYDADAANFAGWNLVGNPYNQNATIDREFYVMNPNGTEIMPAEEDGIKPMQGVFVVANGENQTVTFTPGESQKMASLSLNLSNGRSLIDRAIVRFGEDRQLPKFQMNENSTKVYVPMNGNDYAVVHSEGMGEMPVNFKASKNGSYTLYAQMIEMDLEYLHLIDNFTGADVDLLVTPSYTFNATISDNANRFRLVFGSNNVADTNAESFAYLNNGNLIIEGVQGEATLELVDMLGRVLRTENFNGSYSTRVAESEGVYFVRLIQGNEVKTQKIVF